MKIRNKCQDDNSTTTVMLSTMFKNNNCVKTQIKQASLEGGDRRKGREEESCKMLYNMEG